jgi:glucokinase
MLRHVVAIDVGGTTIKAALVDKNLSIMTTASMPTPKNDFSGVKTVEVVNQLVTNFQQSHPISAIGLAVPGALDEKEGVSRWTGNLGWRDLPIRDLVQASTGLPVAFGHDVRTGALAELMSGAAKGINQSIFIPIGTGIAAALIIDGQIRTSNGYAGEIGHMNVGHEILCVCGMVGCLEAISSALAISVEYQRLSGVVLSTKEIAARIESDTHAKVVWDQAIDFLAIALEDLVTILAPEAIIFGGGVSESGSSLLYPLKAELDARLTFQRRPKLLIAHYGINAGTIGCAIMALELIGEE